MKEENFCDVSIWVGMLIGLTLGLTLGLLIGSGATIESWRKDAVSHGVARYHPTNGRWEWTVPVVKEEPAK